MKTLLLLTALVFATTVSAQAQLRITEVAPWASGNSPYATDWFELTNTGTIAIDITGWRMDDSSGAFSSSVLLTGITVIAPGESVIFTENPATASFLMTWFGGSPPAGLQIGNYSGTGVGLSTSGDAVNIFNAGGALQASISFGAADGVAPFQTFDNSAGLNGTSISMLSAVGSNGAFVAANDPNEIGSPGVVPEPQTYALLVGGGLALLGVAARKRRG
ncbi:MAG: lamin tail domain-containing protein [Chthoniobacterales bacterium]